jgi:hypothetical protein
MIFSIECSKIGRDPKFLLSSYSGSHGLNAAQNSKISKNFKQNLRKTSQNGQRILSKEDSK